MTTIPISDETIVALLQADKPEGIELAYDKFHGALYGAILRIVQQRTLADEVLQDVFVKAWRNRTQYDATKGRLFTWLLNIARNTAIDYTRLKSFSQKNQDLENSVNDIDRTQFVALNPDTIGLREIVAQMPADLRTLLELIYFQGFTQAEAAEKLDIPLGTVKTRVRMALIQLRKLYNLE